MGACRGPQRGESKWRATFLGLRSVTFGGKACDFAGLHFQDFWDTYSAEKTDLQGVLSGFLAGSQLEGGDPGGSPDFRKDFQPEGGDPAARCCSRSLGLKNATPFVLKARWRAYIYIYIYIYIFIYVCKCVYIYIYIFIYVKDIWNVY